MILLSNKSDVTNIAITDARAIPKTPKYFESITFNDILHITPITPLNVVIFVLPIENNVELSMSLMPVKNLPNP